MAWKDEILQLDEMKKRQNSKVYYDLIYVSTHIFIIYAYLCGLGKSVDGCFRRGGLSEKLHFICNI